MNGEAVTLLGLLADHDRLRAMAALALGAHTPSEVAAAAGLDVRRAALRRYLVDEEFLHRRDGFYWRAGGTFEV